MNYIELNRYRDGLRARVRFPTEETYFSLLHSEEVVSSSNSAFCAIGIDGSSFEGKASGCEVNHFIPSSTEANNTGAKPVLPLMLP
jgi:hypothetical protein